MDALYKGIQDATTMIQEQPAEAAKLVAKASGTEAAAKDFEEWMTREGVTYNTEPQGFIAFAEFMKEIGLIEEVPESWEDLVFDNLKGAREADGRRRSPAQAGERRPKRLNRDPFEAERRTLSEHESAMRRAAADVGGAARPVSHGRSGHETSG